MCLYISFVSELNGEHTNKICEWNSACQDDVKRVLYCVMPFFIRQFETHSRRDHSKFMSVDPLLVVTSTTSPSLIPSHFVGKMATAHPTSTRHEMEPTARFQVAPSPYTPQKWERHKILVHLTIYMSRRLPVPCWREP